MSSGFFFFFFFFLPPTFFFRFSRLLLSFSLSLGKKSPLNKRRRTECIPPREIPVVPTLEASTLNSFFFFFCRPSSLLLPPLPPSLSPPFPAVAAAAASGPSSSLTSVPTKNSQSRTRCRSQQLSIKKGRSSAPPLR